MDTQQFAESRLMGLWQMVLVLTLVVCFITLMLDAFKDEDPVPPELVKRHWLMTINLVRGQWYAGNKPDRLYWPTADGQNQVFYLERDSGWPKPVPDCDALWRQIMGSMSNNILALSQRVETQQQDGQNVLGCQYHFNDVELNYYSTTGSVILHQ